MRLLASLAAVFLLSACHDYAPLGGVTPKPDANVRVTLSDSGTLALAQYLGPQVIAVRGRYLGKSDSGTVSLAVSGTETSRDLIPKTWNGEKVELPRYTIATIEGQKIALLPTIGVGAGVAVLLGGTVTSLTGNGFLGIGGSNHAVGHH